MREQAAVDIRIGVLEVEGVSREDAPRFRQDVERELSRLLRERGMPSASSSREQLTATLAVDAGSATAERLAREVAEAVYGVLAR